MQTLPLARQDGFALNLKELAGRLDPPAAVFLGSPNNPTGRVVAAQDILALAQARPDCLLVVDEAFGSFVEGFVSLAALRSSQRGGAGFADQDVRRAGVCVWGCWPPMRSWLARCAPLRAPWSVNALAQAVGQRAMQDSDFEARTRDAVTGLRTELAAWLGGLGGIEVYPGAANYLFCRLAQGSATDLRARLLRNSRVAVRDCSNYPGLEDGFFFAWR